MNQAISIEQQAQTLLSARLRKFLPHGEFAALRLGLQGEERAFFVEKIHEIANLLDTMPKTYQQDGLGDHAIVSLHYFSHASDWYITELDKTGIGTEQAFGWTILGGDRQCAELGYISIDELTACGVELDLYFTPATLASIKANYDRS